MKNIMIPTTLEADTVSAVKTAVRHASGQSCNIVLMQVCEVPDTYSAGYMLHKIMPGYTKAQSEVLTKCKAAIAATPHCRLQVHMQYSISAPLLKNIIEHKGIGLVILSQSYKLETEKIHQYCTRLVLNSKCPILHLGHNTSGQPLNNALYLEQEREGLALHEMQAHLSSLFSFTIVSRATVAEEQNPKDLAPLLAEAIFKNDIDLVVETRKPDKLT
ncbi:MAG: hypothetical protein EOP54_23320, partial [Sphingobacteriales bacterium]